jgi:hypothetical protein
VASDRTTVVRIAAVALVPLLLVASAHAKQVERVPTTVTSTDFRSNAALLHAVRQAATAAEARRAKPHTHHGTRKQHKNRHARNTPVTRQPSVPSATASSTPSTIQPEPPAAQFQPPAPAVRPSRTTAPASHTTSPAAPSDHPKPAKKPRSLGSLLARQLHLSLGLWPMTIAVLLAAAGAALVLSLTRTHRRHAATTTAVATSGHHRAGRRNP